MYSLIPFLINLGVLAGTCKGNFVFPQANDVLYVNNNYSIQWNYLNEYRHIFLVHGDPFILSQTNNGEYILNNNLSTAPNQQLFEWTVPYDLNRYTLDNLNWRFLLSNTSTPHSGTIGGSTGINTLSTFFKIYSNMNISIPQNLILEGTNSSIEMNGINSEDDLELSLYLKYNLDNEIEIIGGTFLASASLEHQNSLDNNFAQISYIDSSNLVFSLSNLDIQDLYIEEPTIYSKITQNNIERYSEQIPIFLIKLALNHNIPSNPYFIEVDLEAYNDPIENSSYNLILYNNDKIEYNNIVRIGSYIIPISHGSYRLVAFYRNNPLLKSNSIEFVSSSTTTSTTSSTSSTMTSTTTTSSTSSTMTSTTTTSSTSSTMTSTTTTSSTSTQTTSQTTSQTTTPTSSQTTTPISTQTTSQTTSQTTTPTSTQTSSYTSTPTTTQTTSYITSQTTTPITTHSTFVMFRQNDNELTLTNNTSTIEPISNAECGNCKDNSELDKNIIILLVVLSIVLLMICTCSYNTYYRDAPRIHPNKTIANSNTNRNTNRNSNTNRNTNRNSSTTLNYERPKQPNRPVPRPCYVDVQYRDRDIDLRPRQANRMIQNNIYKPITRNESTLSFIVPSINENSTIHSSINNENLYDSPLNNEISETCFGRNGSLRQPGYEFLPGSIVASFNNEYNHLHERVNSYHYN